MIGRHQSRSDLILSPSLSLLALTLHQKIEVKVNLTEPQKPKNSRCQQKVDLISRRRCNPLKTHFGVALLFSSTSYPSASSTPNTTVLPQKSPSIIGPRLDITRTCLWFIRIPFPFHIHRFLPSKFLKPSYPTLHKWSLAAIHVANMSYAAIICTLLRQARIKRRTRRRRK